MIIYLDSGLAQNAPLSFFIQNLFASEIGLAGGKLILLLDLSVFFSPLLLTAECHCGSAI